MATHTRSSASRCRAAFLIPTSHGSTASVDFWAIPPSSRPSARTPTDPLKLLRAVDRSAFTSRRGGRQVVHAGEADPLEEEGLLVLVALDAPPALVAPGDADRAGSAPPGGPPPAVGQRAIVDDPDVLTHRAGLDVDGGAIAATAGGGAAEMIESRLPGSRLWAAVQTQQGHQLLVVLPLYVVQPAHGEVPYPGDHQGLEDPQIIHNPLDTELRAARNT